MLGWLGTPASRKPCRPHGYFHFLSDLEAGCWADVPHNFAPAGLRMLDSECPAHLPASNEAMSGTVDARASTHGGDTCLCHESAGSRRDRRPRTRRSSVHSRVPCGLVTDAHVRRSVGSVRERSIIVDEARTSLSPTRRRRRCARAAPGCVDRTKGRASSRAVRWRPSRRGRPTLQRQAR